MFLSSITNTPSASPPLLPTSTTPGGAASYNNEHQRSIFYSQGISGMAHLPRNLVSIFAWSSAITVTQTEPGCPPLHPFSPTIHMLQCGEGIAAKTWNKSGFQPSFFFLAKKEELQLIYILHLLNPPNRNTPYGKEKGKKKTQGFSTFPQSLGSYVIALTRTDLLKNYGTCLLLDQVSQQETILWFGFFVGFFFQQIWYHHQSCSKTHTPHHHHIQTQEPKNNLSRART